MARLLVQGLGYSRGHQMLFDDLSLELGAGQLLLLTGHNGAGKSTLLKLLAGLIEPDQGTILFHSPNDSHSNQAWLGDRNALKLQWTALQNLEFLASLRPANHYDPFKALDYFGLFAVRHQSVSRFSQGMKRRLALASLLLTSAQLWLLDEPQAALDQQGIALFEQMLNQHLQAGGIAVMAAHHAVKLEPQQIQTLSLGSRK
ncbi:heme ABC exporter ATP-binding protein CcmA [Thiomicrospira microaerophila]|uniref:heme ABC exporter ATP-binding protein CcmA n=1 Tax=Thiomicrospira microaerophila TaxID=406020 RepID=UPI00200FE681|nr:heme ABC exporter ATP-binding protein CcmA [Thiomicrospira microaerophila]UQB42340.1 heme ABC exporter ATP-binding protein CcmA [Thiomicrospira microaerophila]